MLPIYFTLIYLVLNAHASTLRAVRAQNVTKREANVGDLFPDWVPFKNKHGEELGDFVQVAKRKPKKRLAPPVNFILRAVAEPQGDDYYDKGQGESEDYYEKKEWSDLYRPEPDSQNNNKTNLTEVSDIDGIVSIITKRPNNAIVKALKKAKQSLVAAKDEESKKLVEKMYKEDTLPKEEVKKSTETKQEKPHKYEDDVEYEESDPGKRTADPVDDEPSDSEVKRTSILDGVDELKDRHAEEQRVINEKVKEEEIYKEQREREKIQAQLSNTEHDKYDDNRRPYKKQHPDYEEYEDKETSLEEKYVVGSKKIKSTAKQSPQRTITHKPTKEKQVETGKLSVFKNPQLYIVYEDDDDDRDETSTMTTTTTTITTSPKIKSRNWKTSRGKKKDKYSSKYSSTPGDKNENERISLLPDENDDKPGEPTLFFPKKRKNKKHKHVPTSPIMDSSPAATVPENMSKQLLMAAEADTKTADTIATDTSSQSGPSASETISLNTDQDADAVAASSDHEAKQKGEDYHREKGAGREYSSSHEEDHMEEGKKAYEGVHKDSKSAKGHHEKENHLGKYDDRAGVDKTHEEESGHYGAHHHEEHGKKHAKYEESGKHSKGHSTKGSHDIHKKEEYEKKVEFFEEEGDSAEEEKHGGHNHEHSHAKGGHFKAGDYKAGHSQNTKGDSGHFAKGGHLQISKGHKEAGGFEGHGQKGQENHAKGNKQAGKKWIYHHGSPAKTANLVRIDRRVDQLHHGPLYYG